MASISNDGGTRRLLFVGEDGKRKAIRLGDIDQKTAERFRLRVERIIAANLTRNPLDDETSRWLADLPDVMHGKLAAVGLVPARESSGATLQQLLDAFFEHLNVKPLTAIGYKPAKDSLLAYFGADTPIRSIQPLQADEWRAKMKADGLAEATISKRVGIAKHIFRRAVVWKMLPDNPFSGVRTGSQINKARQRFISMEDAQKVLDACPDTQWRLLFALSRFAGLRCPTEHLALKWADVDWERGRLRITCSKTSHRAGRGERLCPLFPELRPYLLAAFEEAEPGTEYVITKYRKANCNLRTQLERIIRKAGLVPWPRLFQNLRATRQTELTSRFPAHVVSSWIGNTEKVALNHYLQTTDEHFAQAIIETPAKAAQNPAQYLPIQAHMEGNASDAPKSECFGVSKLTDRCKSLLDNQIAATGFEPVT